jgi:hypothetical protein
MAATVATAVWETVKTRYPAPTLQAGKANLDRVRPIAYTNGVADSHESGESGLEGRDLLAKDVDAAFENPSDGGIDCGALREVAGTWIGLRNRL